MRLARGHRGHGQVEILEVGARPLDLSLGDGEEAGTGLDLGLLPRHGDGGWLTCHSNCHYTVGVITGSSYHITGVYLLKICKPKHSRFLVKEQNIKTKLTVAPLQMLNTDN